VEEEEEEMEEGRRKKEETKETREEAEEVKVEEEGERDGARADSLEAKGSDSTPTTDSEKILAEIRSPSPPPS
jgi:hypothetical protein